MNLIKDYLLNFYQRTKVDSKFSRWHKIIILGVPHGSILDSMLINIFTCDMFLFLHIVQCTGYADDNNSVVFKGNITHAI